MNKKYIIGICGSFGAAAETYDGQTVKTRNLNEALKMNLGESSTIAMNTHFWRKKPFSTFMQCLHLAKNCKKIIILPAQRGLKVFLPLFAALKKIFGFDLYYDVVGGWLPQAAENNSRLKKYLKSLDCIFVETKAMMKMLGDIGVTNVSVLPNFKMMKPLETDELVYQTEFPLKLCTFSRVMEEKGITDAIRAVSKVNNEFKKTVYSLDIYGNIDSSYEEKFASLLNESAEYVRYKGCVPPQSSIDVVKNYYALLFPTYYDGEGFAGTIIDAFSAGVPVIASDWKYNSEIVTDGVTGHLFPPKDSTALETALKKLAAEPDKLNSMKENCIKIAQTYTPSTVIDKLFKEMRISDI